MPVENPGVIFQGEHDLKGVEGEVVTVIPVRLPVPDAAVQSVSPPIK